MVKGDREEVNLARTLFPTRPPESKTNHHGWLTTRGASTCGPWLPRTSLTSLPVGIGQSGGATFRVGVAPRPWGRSLTGSSSIGVSRIGRSVSFGNVATYTSQLGVERSFRIPSTTLLRFVIRRLGDGVTFLVTSGRSVLYLRHASTLPCPRRRICPRPQSDEVVVGVGLPCRVGSAV